MLYACASLKGNQSSGIVAKICYLFVQDGVYRIPDDFQDVTFKSIIWALIHSDDTQVYILAYEFVPEFHSQPFRHLPTFPV